MNGQPTAGQGKLGTTTSKRKVPQLVWIAAGLGVLATNLSLAHFITSLSGPASPETPVAVPAPQPSEQIPDPAPQGQEEELRQSRLSQVEAQLEARARMEEILRDPDDAQFIDVHAYLISAKGDPANYGFCGTLNAKNGFGGYTGQQRFVANPAIAIVEEGTPDFSEIWALACLPDADLGEVWF